MVELYRYGRHISRATAMNYVVTQLDRALVGRMLGPGARGLYAFAARLAILPSAGAYKVIFGVAFPVFSRLQADAGRVRSGLLKALGSMGALVVPVGAGLFAVSADLVIVLFGPKWAEMIPAFQVLCLGGACMGLYQLVGAITRELGRPDIGARTTYILLEVIAAFLYPGIRIWGIHGGAVLYVGLALPLDRWLGSGIMDSVRSLRRT